VREISQNNLYNMKITSTKEEGIHVYLFIS